MSLDPELDGLWRLESEVSDGRESSPAPWLYSFNEGKHKEIVPHEPVDERLRSTYECDLTVSPRRLVITLDYNGPDGPPDLNPIILPGVYEVDGNTLRITYAAEHECPESITDRFPYSIQTLVRVQDGDQKSGDDQK